MVLIPRRWYHARDDASHHTGNGGQKARCTGESAIYAVKPSRGECRMSRLNLWYLPPAFFSAGGPWARPAPGIPCALSLFEGVREPHDSGASAARMRLAAFPELTPAFNPTLTNGPACTAGNAAQTGVPLALVRAMGDVI